MVIRWDSVGTAQAHGCLGEPLKPVEFVSRHAVDRAPGARPLDSHELGLGEAREFEKKIRRKAREGHGPILTAKPQITHLML